MKNGVTILDHYMIVDGSNLLFQMFYGMPSRITGRHGRPIHGTVGFVGALLKIIKWIQPTHICVCFDGECDNFRKELNADYKSNRPDYENMPDDMLPFSQLPDIYAALDYLGICHSETNCCEADDWMASFAKIYGEQGRVTIVSQDSDLFQLITDRVSVLRYRGQNSIICDPVYILEKLGVRPEQYADFKSLTGDASDNIKGAVGVGPKTAAKLIKHFGSLESVLTNIKDIERPALRISLQDCAERLRNNKSMIFLDGKQLLPFTQEQMRWEYRGQTLNQVLRDVGIR